MNERRLISPKALRWETRTGTSLDDSVVDGKSLPRPEIQEVSVCGDVTRSTLGGLLEALTISLGQIPQGLADEWKFRILLL